MKGNSQSKSIMNSNMSRALIFCNFRKELIANKYAAKDISVLIIIQYCP